MKTMKTSGAYVTEKNAFPSPAVAVATAIPAFIGYTEKIVNGNESLLNKPVRIDSMAEFHSYFGGAPIPMFTLVDAEGHKGSLLECGNRKFVVKRTGLPFILYYQLQMFFGNGGGPCYIVSIGDYTVDQLDVNAFKRGIDTLLKEQEPTMILCPEAVNITERDSCYDLQRTILNHCGQMRNRIAILDIFEGYKDIKDSSGNVIDEFRNNIGKSYLDFGVAYYPWLNTSVVEERNLTLLNIDTEALKTILEEEYKSLDSQKRTINMEQINKIDVQMDLAGKMVLHAMLMQNSRIYKEIFKGMREILNLLPPSAAMAGLYTAVDNSGGVWKVAANVSINMAISLPVNITNSDQEDLNVPLSGKAINAIRFFVGQGIIVWGGRTLDGNSLDWRYIQVRRTVIMLEQSIKNAVSAYTYEPNDAQTWLIMKCMIESFLIGIWKQGGLAGVTPSDAFSVHIGLGDTMTQKDIIDGIVRVTVLVAIVRPAEFIKITFQQPMLDN